MKEVDTEEGLPDRLTDGNDGQVLLESSGVEEVNK